MIKLIIPKTIKYFTLILGFLFVIIFIYKTFFQYIYPLNINIYYIKYLIVFSFIMQVLNLCRKIKTYLVIIITRYVSKFYENFYWKPLNSFYDLIKKYPGIGDLLYYWSKLFLRLAISLGNNSMLLLCFLFVLIPNICLSYIFITIIFFEVTFSSYIYVCLPVSFIILRITHLIIFVLQDFAEKNKKALEPYIIVTSITKKTKKYALNTTTVKNPSKEKAELYAERYITFSNTLVFTNLYLYYRNYVIKPIIKPILIAIFFIFTLHLISTFTFLVLSKTVLLICFIFVFIIEFLNINEKYYTKNKEPLTNDDI